jgi:hypothetical protein
VDVAVALTSLALLVWFLARLVRRTCEARAQARALQGDAAAATPVRFAYLGNAADALAFALLLSPSVWEHHYVLALPFAIWVVATGWSSRPLAIAFGIFLMLAMPSFDVFPVGYHRLAGMLWLLLLTPSRRLPNSSSADWRQSRASQARI